MLRPATRILTCKWDAVLMLTTKVSLQSKRGKLRRQREEPCPEKSETSTGMRNGKKSSPLERSERPTVRIREKLTTNGPGPKGIRTRGTGETHPKRN